MNTVKRVLPYAKMLWFALIINIFCVNIVKAEGVHPNMYLNQEEIDSIKIKIDEKMEPWFSAYSKVISAANSALNKSPLSVTFQGKTNSQYFTEKPYCGWPDGCRDGQINPNADRGDYNAAIRLGDTVRDLGLAYAFTGEARYADKAIEMIRVWSLNPGTRMKPTTSAGNRIELFITLPGYFYGADLIWSYGGWDSGEKAAFASWVKSVGDHAKANGAGLNNFANWRVVLIASAGALLDDTTLLNFAEKEWKRLVSLQMNDAGSATAGILGQEKGRSKGLHYSLYAINAMIQGAEILRHRNIDLYDYQDNKGRSLELALDFITPYAINPNSWPYQQITTITQNDSMALYELAYSYYEKPLYLDAINRWTRPLDETRVMGINTLTHANRFDLDETRPTPTAPSIVTQPDNVTVTEGGSASFSVVSSGSGSLAYQWFRDGTLISGATSASYTVSAVSSSDNGSVYNCDVSNNLGSVSSNGAVLVVSSSDSTAPMLVSATATNDTRVDIVFSESVSASSAEVTDNYQIDLGISVMAANLSSDGRTVSLSVSSLTVDTTYTVQVSNVQDLAESPNTIVAQSSTSFTYRNSVSEALSDEFNSTSLDLAQWTFVDPISDSAASVTNGQLVISVGGGLSHDIWRSGNNSARVTHATANQDFFAEVKFDSTPDQKYQLQGVLVEQDANNFIRFDFYSDGNNLKIFAATFQAGQPTVKVNRVIATGGSLYMRVKREGNQWIQEYSYDGNNWQTAVTFAHTLTVASTNLFAGNAGENVPAFTAQIDYYRTDAQ